MPTSAGKTRSVDLILRGAFYSNRTSLAMVVAPFRALCEEIRQSLPEPLHKKGEPSSSVISASLDVVSRAQPSRTGRGKKTGRVGGRKLRITYQWTAAYDPWLIFNSQANAQATVTLRMTTSSFGTS